MQWVEYVMSSQPAVSMNAVSKHDYVWTTITLSPLHTMTQPITHSGVNRLILEIMVLCVIMTHSQIQFLFYTALLYSNLSYSTQLCSILPLLYLY